MNTRYLGQGHYQQQSEYNPHDGNVFHFKKICVRASMTNVRDIVRKIFACGSTHTAVVKRLYKEAVVIRAGVYF